MVLFAWTNSWMHMFELVISSICALILGGWYGTGGGWEFILTENWANQIYQKVKIVLFTQPQVHKRGDRYIHLRWDKDLSSLLKPLMSGIQKCSTYRNCFCFKTDLD